MNLAIVINVRHPEWEGSRIESLVDAWEKEGLVRRVRPGAYVVTPTGIENGTVEQIEECRALRAEVRAATNELRKRIAQLETLKAKCEREHEQVPARLTELLADATHTLIAAS